MNTTLFPEFLELYKTFKQSEDYSLRVKQFAIAEVNKEIIVETLKNEPLLNEHLTGLIQMFKYGCSDDIFDKYLNQNVTNPARRNEISKKTTEIDEWGYTGAGLNAITNLTPVQLSTIKTFIHNAFAVTTVEGAIKLCINFDNENIPLVKSGIYSPWLYYINPQVFPILNNSHIKFRDWIGMASDYPSCIKDFNDLKVLLKESELGLIDMFAHLFEKYSKKPTNMTTLDLKGKKLYKISHGIFKKNSTFRNAGILGILEKNNWISMGLDTGKGQATEFTDNATIGDFVYICYGGDDLYAIGEIISDSKSFEPEIVKLLNSQEEWIYREIELLYSPKISSVREFKSDAHFFMPSGNSTFYQVPSKELDFMNSNIFSPKFNIKIIDTKAGNSGSQTNKEGNIINKDAMNIILYGPPGTGKTYNAISHSVAIVENKTLQLILNEEREIVKNRFDQYIKDGQIVFTTFHQSMGYEDFIEGIKPIEPNTEDEQLFYAVEDGIFKRLCTEAAFSFVQQNITSETEKVLDFSTEYDRFVDTVNERFLNGKRTELETRSGGNVYIESISQKNNIWVRHIDGNRKYTVSKKRISKISQAYPDLSEVTNIHDQFKAEIGGSNSSAYWAVLNAIRNQPIDNSLKTNKKISEKEYSYEDKKDIIESLKNDDFKIEDPKRFVLIIDEINRGNVSQIFGELITLIEEDKRLGKNESLKTTLPYSKESFGVPCNISIIGTMNTADRSVEALDAALRRRFSFVQMSPNPELLKATIDGINLLKILGVLNNRLTILKDNDHTVGHAWFWNVKNIDQLRSVFGNKILPLLQEYFYNDYEKLGLVLGDSFFKPHLQVNSNIFASFSGGNGLAGQYDQTWQYQLKPVDELTIADFQSLEQQDNHPITDEE